MKTTINNSERVFLVTTSTGDRVFCNLGDLEKVVKELGANAGYFKIFHFWNGKQEKVSKKYLSELYESNYKSQVPFNY